MMTRSFTSSCFLQCLFILILTAGTSPSLFGQRSAGGTPPGIRYSLRTEEQFTLRLNPPDLAAVEREDALLAPEFRFAIDLPVNAGMEDAGYWTTLPDGSRNWRLAIEAPGALALSVYFDTYQLPEGGELFLYNEDGSVISGAFTARNNHPSGLFAAGLIPGDRITLEYSEPLGTARTARIHVSEVAYAYRGVGASTEEKTRGQAGDCEVNVACPEGSGWGRQIKGATRIQTRKFGGSYWCSGSLVNNTLEDGTPYVLTADHCGRGATTAEYEQWIFYFNYQSASCSSSVPPAVPQSLTGAQKISCGGDVNASGSDFLLVLLNDVVPGSYNAVLNGWNRTGEASSSGVAIHHPMGDVKKISTYTSPVISSSWTGEEMTHWMVKWAATLNGHGVTEGGSSGCPMFDGNGYIIGTLTGGESSCDSLDLGKPDYFGKFSYSWDQCGTDSTEQLAPWLDPANTGALTLGDLPIPVEEYAPAGIICRVYPNPASDRIWLRCTAGNEPVRMISIEDLNGHVLIRFRPVQTSEEIGVDVNGLAPGMYIVNVGTDRALGHSKFLKKP